VFPVQKGKFLQKHAGRKGRKCSSLNLKGGKDALKKEGQKTSTSCKKPLRRIEKKRVLSKIGRGLAPEGGSKKKKGGAQFLGGRKKKIGRNF